MQILHNMTTTSKEKKFDFCLFVESKNGSSKKTKVPASVVLCLQFFSNFADFHNLMRVHFMSYQQQKRKGVYVTKMSTTYKPMSLFRANLTFGMEMKI